MNTVVTFFRENKINILFYFFASGFIFYLTRNYVDSADLIQYLSLAEQYQKLSLFEVANDFWSPLLSWLIIPLNYFIKNNLFAFKALQWILVNIGYLMLVYQCKKFTFSNAEKILIHFSIGVLFLSYGVCNGSPDLLYLDILVFILLLVQIKEQSWLTVALIGTGGGFLYLTKSFGIVFFALFILADFVFLKEKTWLNFKRFFVILFFFGLVSCTWILFLSKKNQEFTYSGAAVYNFSIMNPKINPNVFGEIKHPIDTLHFKSPPNHISTSAWQEPNKFGLPHWSPKNYIKHYLKVIFKNIISLAYYYFNSILFLSVSILLMLSTYRKRNNSTTISSPQILKKVVNQLFFSESHLMIAVKITTFLYLLILTQKRYLWINEVYLLTLILGTLEHLNTRIKQVFLLALFLMTLFSSTHELSPVFTSKLNTNWKTDPIVSALKKDNYSKKIVSDIQLGPEGYTVSCAISFESDIQNFGVCDPSQLQKLDFKGYFISEGNSAINPAVHPFLTFMCYSPELNCSLYMVNPA